MKAGRNQPFSARDEVAAYYELYYRGPEGFAAIYLQKDLVAAGFLKSNQVDGSIGPDTIGALVSYERERGRELKPPIIIPNHLRSNRSQHR
jgi:hypothetical protein